MVGILRVLAQISDMARGAGKLNRMAQYRFHHQHRSFREHTQTVANIACSVAFVELAQHHQVHVEHLGSHVQHGTDTVGVRKPASNGQFPQRVQAGDMSVTRPGGRNVRIGFVGWLHGA